MRLPCREGGILNTAIPGSIDSASKSPPYKMFSDVSWDDLFTVIQVEDGVLVFLIEATGSTPRESGTWMFIGGKTTLGSIGGGRLEYTAISESRKLLAKPVRDGEGRGIASVREYSLGASLGQCCGGNLKLVFLPILGLSAPEGGGLRTVPWLEELKCRYSKGVESVLAIPLPDFGLSCPTPFIIRETESGKMGGIDDKSDRCHIPVTPACGLSVMLFGAGHVAKAIVGILRQIDCEVTWIDSREGVFDGLGEIRNTGFKCTLVNDDDTNDRIDSAKADTKFLVMTHSHAIDGKIVERVLQRNEISYLGMIGSLTKRKKLERRLVGKGLSEERLSLLTCPIGISGIRGKAPGIIAASAVAQLLMSP